LAAAPAGQQACSAQQQGKAARFWNDADAAQNDRAADIAERQRRAWIEAQTTQIESGLEIRIGCQWPAPLNLIQSL